MEGREMATQVPASADMQFRRENPHERQARPLAEAKTSEELFTRVVQRGLYAIDSRGRQERHLCPTWSGMVRHRHPKGMRPRGQVGLTGALATLCWLLV